MARHRFRPFPGPGRIVFCAFTFLPWVIWKIINYSVRFWVCTAVFMTFLLMSLPVVIPAYSVSMAGFVIQNYQSELVTKTQQAVSVFNDSLDITIDSVNLSLDIMTPLVMIYNGLVDLITIIFKAIKDAIPNVSDPNSVRPMGYDPNFVAFLKVLQDYTKIIVQAVVDFFLMSIEFLAQSVRTILDLIISLPGLAAGVINWIIDIINDLKSRLLEFANDFIGGAQGVVNSMIEGTEVVINGIVFAIRTSVMGVVEGINVSISALTDFFNDFLATMTGALRSVIGGIISGVDSIVYGLCNFIVELDVLDIFDLDANTCRVGANLNSIQAPSYSAVAINLDPDFISDISIERVEFDRVDSGDVADIPHIQTRGDRGKNQGQEAEHRHVITDFVGHATHAKRTHESSEEEEPGSMSSKEVHDYIASDRHTDEKCKKIVKMYAESNGNSSVSLSAAYLLCHMSAGIDLRFQRSFNTSPGEVSSLRDAETYSVNSIAQGFRGLTEHHSHQGAVKWARADYRSKTAKDAVDGAMNHVSKRIAGYKNDAMASVNQTAANATSYVVQMLVSAGEKVKNASETFGVARSIYDTLSRVYNAMGPVHSDMKASIYEYLPKKDNYTDPDYKIISRRAEEWARWTDWREVTKALADGKESAIAAGATPPSDYVNRMVDLVFSVITDLMNTTSHPSHHSRTRKTSAKFLSAGSANNMTESRGKEGISPSEFLSTMWSKNASLQSPFDILDTYVALASPQSYWDRLWDCTPDEDNGVYCFPKVNPFKRVNYHHVHPPGIPQGHWEPELRCSAFGYKYDIFHVGYRGFFVSVVVNFWSGFKFLMKYSANVHRGSAVWTSAFKVLEWTYYVPLLGNYANPESLKFPADTVPPDAKYCFWYNGAFSILFVGTSLIIATVFFASYSILIAYFVRDAVSVVIKCLPTPIMWVVKSREKQMTVNEYAEINDARFEGLFARMKKIEESRSETKSVDHVSIPVANVAHQIIAKTRRNHFIGTKKMHTG